MEQRPTILIVDQDPRICRLIQRYLEQEGYRICTATSRKEMEQKLADWQIDLVLLDVGLPDKDSFTLLSSMPNLAIILVMHKREAGHQLLGLRFGAVSYVTKPFDERKLLARIRSVLRRRSMPI